MDAARPKLLEISGPEPVPLAVDERPQDLMRKLSEKLANAKFTNEADRPKVRRLIYDFEWMVMQAVDDSEIAETEADRGARAPILETDQREATKKESKLYMFRAFAKQIVGVGVPRMPAEVKTDPKTEVDDV